MKVNKRIVKYLCLCIVFGLAIQNGIFFYFNKKYEKGQMKIKSIKVENTNNKKTKTEIKFSENAKNIQIAFNGKYISYFEDSVLKVLDVEKNNVLEIKPESGEKIVFCKWLEDQASMIVIERNKENFDFYSYDARKNSKRELLDFDMNKFKIKIKGNDDRIEDIVSSSTNVMYIKVSRGERHSDIYKVNIMNELDLVKSNIICTGNIAIPPKGTSLIYKDSGKLMMLINDKEKEIHLDDSENMSVIGIDEKNNLYLAKTNGNEITNILYGCIEDNPIKFTSVNITEKLEKDKIIFDKKGNVIFNDCNEHKLIDLITKKSIDYTGIFLGEYNKGIITLNDSKLNFTVFNEK